MQNGRLRGTRRALTSALTLIGRDPACAFHLNVDGVHPLHCAIVRSPDGFLLRDLGGDSGTFVNGEAVHESPLRHGDVIAVGPFQFSLHVPEDGEPVSAAALQTERDALRIQAAAVAAQQAALAEEEAQLQQRRKALARQKEQLAAHLEERRQQLVQLREQARQDRAALKAETEAARRQNEDVRATLSKEREAVQKELQQAGKERRRSIEFRKRLKKRWRKHWQAHEAALQRREQLSMAERAKIERDAEDLQRERVQLTQAQLRFNGEVELGRRQLQDEWQQLGLAQQQWEACLNQEQTERKWRLRELDKRAAGLAATEQKLAEHRRLAEQFQLHLRKEAEGLETRIRNQRLKLLEHEKQLNEAASGVASAPRECSLGALTQPRSPQPPDVPRVLARLAGDLTDQRRHLLEQWQCLLELHDLWEPERVALLAQFETAARELVLVEQRLTAREQALAGGETDLRRRQQTLFDVRCSLEAWQARLTVRETFLDNERVMLLADVRAREELAEGQMQRVEEMRQRRARRRSQEIDELRRPRSTRADAPRLRAAVAGVPGSPRRVDPRATRVRRQGAGSGTVPSGTARPRRRFAGSGQTLGTSAPSQSARFKAEERDLQRERASLMGETKRLDQRAARLIEQEQTLVVQHEDWMKQVADWEDRQAAAADLEQHRQQELRHWQLLHERDERQLIELREEVERIAQLLLEEAEATTSPSLAA